MRKDKLRLFGMKLKGMQMQILLRLDKFPDNWKNFETPEEQRRLKQEFLARVKKDWYK